MSEWTNIFVERKYLIWGSAELESCKETGMLESRSLAVVEDGVRSGTASGDY